MLSRTRPPPPSSDGHGAHCGADVHASAGQRRALQARGEARAFFFSFFSRPQTQLTFSRARHALRSSVAECHTQADTQTHGQHGDDVHSRRAVLPSAGYMSSGAIFHPISIFSISQLSLLRPLPSIPSRKSSDTKLVQIHPLSPHALPTLNRRRGRRTRRRAATGRPPRRSPSPTCPHGCRRRIRINVQTQLSATKAVRA